MQGRQRVRKDTDRGQEAGGKEEGTREEKLPREAEFALPLGLVMQLGWSEYLWGCPVGTVPLRGEMASLPLRVPTTHLRLHWALRERLEEQRQLCAPKSAACDGNALPDRGYHAG